MLSTLFAVVLYGTLTVQAPITPPTTLVSNPIDYVDLFYGTEGGGHMFPGSTRPFGMAKLGIDVIDPKFGDAYSGYGPGGVVTGISMMHESGTGGAPEYGIVSQLPFTATFDPLVQTYVTRVGHDIAKVGYYNFNTTDGIIAEFAAAERSGLTLYEFLESSYPQLLVNVSHHLAAPSRPWWTQYFINGTISASPNLSGYSGSVTTKGGWGDQEPWTLYFYAEFETNASLVKAFLEHGVSQDISSHSSQQDGSLGLIFEWNNTSTIKSKIGISFISIDQAAQNLQNDLANNDYSIEDLVSDTQEIWNKEVFSKIAISSENDTLTSMIYTSLYGAHLIPSNRTGENPYWPDGGTTYYDDWFTIWDTFRCLNPLYNIINPIRASELVQSLIEIYQKDGYTPDGRSANQNGRTQGGSNSDILFADAYVKGIPNIDWEDAFAAMVKNAEVTPPYWYDSFAPDASTKDGRGALPDWLQYGYITRHYSRSVSRTIDYSYDDYALAVVAQGLGNQTAYEKYLKRSANWQNIWNFNATAEGKSYKGFVQPRNADGTFNYTNYDPFSCGGCYWNDDEYEGKPAEYGWSVPFDIATLIDFIGDNATFISRLDDMYGLHGASEVVDVGNEPSFLTPYLYNYVNEQHRSVETVRYIVNNYFTTGASGLPGNSDGGAMQAWLLFGLLGFYPVAGTPNYLLSSPFIEYIKLDLSNGNYVEITTNNLSQENIYVQSIQIDGSDHYQNWIDHSIFQTGGSITFNLGNQPVSWEQGSAPPSPGHYKST